MTEESLVDQELQDQDEDQEVDLNLDDESETEGETPEDEEETIVTIEGDTPPQDDEEGFEGQPAPQWVKDLRKSEREQKRKIKELEQQLESKEKPVEDEVVLGAKPTLDGFDYDTDAYETALERWHSDKAIVESKAREKQAETDKQNQAWQGVLDSYNEKKTALKVRDYDEAEFALTEKFDQVQQSVVLKATKNPAMVVYALGKSPQRLEELSKIKDPIELAVAVALLETKMKTNTRKASTAPEKKISNGGSLSATHDTTLERLRKDAEKTGDFSKVVQYKRKLRQK